jgi:hypothetical protein
MPPSNFFGSLGNTNLLRTHGTSPRSLLNFADDAKVPGHRIHKKWGLPWGPDKRRQLRGKGDGRPQSAQRRTAGCVPNDCVPNPALMFF